MVGEERKTLAAVVCACIFKAGDVSERGEDDRGYLFHRKTGNADRLSIP